MKTRKMALSIISILIAVAGTWLYVSGKNSGRPVPYYALGMLAYGWIFIIYSTIDSAARGFKKRYRGK